MNLITVQCMHEDSNYVQIAALPDALVLTFLDIGTGKKQIVRGELLSFKDYPELRGIHDKRGWNTTELNLLIENTRTGGVTL